MKAEGEWCAQHKERFRLCLAYCYCSTSFLESLLSKSLEIHCQLWRILEREIKCSFFCGRNTAYLKGWLCSILFTGKAGARVNTFHKTVQQKQSANSLHVKIPQSPSIQQSSPGQASPQQSQQQQRTVIPSSPQQGQQTLYLNHQHIPTSQQPIAQLKQQVEQQQQQLQQITLQQQLQQQQQFQQQQFQTQQKHQQLNAQFLKQQLPIQPRIAPAPPQPTQTFISQQTIAGQNIIVKTADQQLNSPPGAVFVKSEPRRDLQPAVLQKPQSNVAWYGSVCESSVFFLTSFTLFIIEKYSLFFAPITGMTKCYNDIPFNAAFDQAEYWR